MNGTYYCAALGDLRVAQDLLAVDESEHYQAVRDEINAGMRGPDWGNIKRHTEKLGRETGFNLLASAYYAVAAARTEGLQGLANGLEMVLGVWLQPPNEDANPPAAGRNTLNWMANRVVEVVKDPEQSVAQLHILYRCERACATFERALDGAEVIGLHTLHSHLKNKIDRIEKSIPPPPAPPPEEEREPPPRGRFKAIAALILLPLAVGTSVFLLWFAEEPQPEPKPLISLVTEPRAVPKALDVSQIEAIRAIHPVEEWQRNEARIQAAYRSEIERHIQRETPSSLTQSKPLLETLNLLYPDDAELATRKADLAAIRKAKQESLPDLYERFRQARTAMANLNLVVRRLNADDPQTRRVKELAQRIENYAVSLSPLVGRVLYMERMLEEGQTNLAETELRKLNEYVNALVFKIDELKKTLERGS